MKKKILIACIVAFVAISSSIPVGCKKNNTERTADCEVEITVAEKGFEVKEKVLFDFQEGDCLYLGENEVIVSSLAVNGNELSFVFSDGLLSFDYERGVNEITLSYIAADNSENKIIEPARVIDRNDSNAFNAPVGYYSDFSLTLTAPLSYVVAAPFLVTARDTGESSVTYFYDAKSVLSFAAVLSKNFIVSENKSGNKSIKRYVFTENADLEALTYSAFSSLTDYLGDYPYAQLVCGETDGERELSCGGSMFVSEYSVEKRFAVVKNLARQWCFGKIRQSSRFCSFGDFMSMYIALVYFAENGNETDKSFAKERFEGMLAAPKTYTGVRRKTEKTYKPTVCRSAKEFSDKLEYAAVGVDGGVCALLAAEAAVGRKTLLKIIKRLFASNERQTITKQVFLDSFNGYPSCKRIVSALLSGDAFD